MREGSPLEFPCVMSVKAVGRWSEDFEEHVLALARRHAASAEAESDRGRTSRSGVYRAVTLRVSFDDRAQLDALYAALTDDPRVLWSM